MVETHSYKLSPFGPALQLGGGSNVISANSFCILLAEVPKAFDIFGFGLASLLSGLLSAKEEPRPRPVPLDPAPDDMIARRKDEIPAQPKRRELGTTYVPGTRSRRL